MKKVFYTLTIAIAATFTSCGEAKEEIKEEVSENVESPEEESEEIIEDELKDGEVMINGMHFYGLNEFNPGENMVSVDEMYAEVIENGSFEGQIKAEIVDVCKKAGCWITVKKEDGSTVRITFKDHFGIPTDTPSGYDAILNGTATLDTTSIEMQKHFLDDAKEAGEEVSDSEYDAITEDLIEVSFVCDGIVIPE